MHIAIDGTAAINDLRAIKRYTWQLIRQLSIIKSDIEYTALYLSSKGITDDKLPGIPSPKFVNIKSLIPGKILKFLWAFTNFPDARFFINRNFDIFHFPAGYAYLPVKNKIVISTTHGFAFQFIPRLMDKNLLSESIKKLEKTIRVSDYFITVSETNKSELNKLWNVSLDKITAIPLGVGEEFRVRNDLIHDEKRIRSKYLLGDNDFLLFVGAIEPHKNIHGIIEAYALLESAVKRNFNLVFVGAKTKYTEEYIELTRKRGVTDNVIWVDYISPDSEDLPLLYNIAELFIFPTFYEGWASPPLEAMKCGTPAIVANIPSLQESTGGIAAYCDPNNPKDISAKIAELINDRSKYEKIQDDGLFFASQYTWQRCAEKTISSYKKLVP